MLSINAGIDILNLDGFIRVTRQENMKLTEPLVRDSPTSRDDLPPKNVST